MNYVSSTNDLMTINIVPVNDVYVKIECEPSIAQSLSDKFSFLIPNARFHPAVKAKRWDGMFRLFPVRTHLLYRGLMHHVVEFCKEHDFDYHVDRSLLSTEEFTKNTALRFISGLKLPSKFELRDYQIDAFVKCINNKRGLFVLPTGSGKSMVIYWLVRFFPPTRNKTLIIVDSLNLIHQMHSDFKDYGFDSDKFIHLIYSGQDKTSPKPIYLTTWQSAVKQPKAWFDQFGLVIGDEAHQYDAKSFKTIMESLIQCPYRFGFTGTLSGAKCNQMVLEGLFGQYHKSVSTANLIDSGHLSPVEVNCLVLKYTHADKRALGSKATYQEELDFIYTNEKRNKFIRKLACSLKGNTLLLFQRVEQHGIPLYEALQNETEVPVYYVSGKIDGKEREEIRQIVNTHENSITVASVGTFSKGINIPKINNIVIASPTKSQIRVLQSIGRGLRKSKGKENCKIYDIADDLTGHKHKNYTWKHFIERMKMYVKEEFPYKTYIFNLTS